MIFIHFAPVVLLTASSKINVLVLFYGQPYKSLGVRQGYLLVSLPSCFTATDFMMVLNSLDDSVVPQKRNIAIFFHFPKEKGLDINRLEENQLFSARVQLGFIALHKKLVGGFFCEGEFYD